MKPTEIIRRWSRDAHTFVRECLRVETVSRQQVDLLNAVTALVWAKIKHSRGEELTEGERDLALRRGISVMSGHGTGKDASTAWVILWFLICFPYSRIPCTAPTQHQLRDVLWGEINKWIRHSDSQHQVAATGFKLSDWIHWQADRVYFKDSEGREWYAVARTSNTKATAEAQAETLAGFHEDFLMFVVDEASGVPDPVYLPIEGSMTGKCNFALLIFNPTQLRSYAVETHTTKDRSNWITMRWNAENSELVSRNQIESMARKYGRDSNAYRIRVLGLPPKADADTLIPWDLVMDAVDREVSPTEDDPIIMAIDVARFGDDDSAILTMHGPRVLPVDKYHGLDTEQLSGWAMGKIFDVEPKLVFVDTIGVGAGVADKLRHRTTATIIDINAQELPSQEERFHKLRDELWWRMREAFEKRVISIPNDDELIGELTTPKYEMDMGKVKVESKKKMKARGIMSPNKADALAMCFYYEKNFVRKMRQPATGRVAAAGSWRTS